MVPVGVWKYTRGWGLVSGLVTAAMLEQNPPAEVVKWGGERRTKLRLSKMGKKMMNDLEAATRSNLVLLLSGFAHEGGDRLWPGRFRETKGTDGNSGTVLRDRRRALPARKLCRLKQKGGLNSSSSTKKNRTSLLSDLTRTACVRALRKKNGSSASDATEKKGSQQRQTSLFLILPANFWEPVLHWLLGFLRVGSAAPPFPFVLHTSRTD